MIATERADGQKVLPSVLVMSPVLFTLLSPTKRKRSIRTFVAQMTRIRTLQLGGTAGSHPTKKPVSSRRRGFNRSSLPNINRTAMTSRPLACLVAAKAASAAAVVIDFDLI
jgi:hypothetical protein